MQIALFLHIIDYIVFIVSVSTCIYILVFACASRFRKSFTGNRNTAKSNRFAVIFPCYGEDRVVLNSVSTFLKQTYPNYHLIVVTDHMTESTNLQLERMPLTLLRATYANSSKAKALQFACSMIEDKDDFVVILDADNIVQNDFLEKLNQQCLESSIAIQAHRLAKKAEHPIAVLDAVSEEINNSIFRRGHNVLGLSSALIGSGICLNKDWFKENIFSISSSGEDKEFEALLLWNRHHIQFVEDILVFDEKVKSGRNFQQQRRRWMAAQMYSLQLMLKRLPQAILHRKWDYIDKTIQQMLIPRSIFICICVLFTTITLLFAPTASLKWIILTFFTFLALALSIPKYLYNDRLIKSIVYLPTLSVLMILNLFKLKGAAHFFIHTEHDD